MLWSRLFIPTLRANPAVESAAVQLLQRAAYLRGPNSWLPLARRSLRRIVAVIRAEFDAAGAQEMLLPTHQSFETIARELRSYKQLPQTWYSFGAHLEARSFSFEALPFADLCARILDCCGITHSRTEHSLVVFSDEGTDSVVFCSACGYAAAAELAAAVASKPSREDSAGDLSPEAFHTPGHKTIAQVSEFTGLPESSQMKSLVLVANDTPVLVMLRGDHQMSEAKFAALTGDPKFRPARSDELFEWFGAGAGSLGPVGVRNMHVLMDTALSGRRNMISGANRDDYHLRNVTPGKDFEAEAHDLRQIVPGDACVHCGAAIGTRNAIELARFHPPRPAADLYATSASGQEVPLLTAACHIAVDRLLLAAATSHRDNDGLVLPPAIAPFDVIITPANYSDAAQRDAANAIYAEAKSLGLEPLLDDRDERPGVKFKDADLIGVPFRITVGKKLSEGLVEILERRTKQVTSTAAAEAAAAVRRAITGESSYAAIRSADIPPGP